VVDYIKTSSKEAQEALADKVYNRALDKTKVIEQNAAFTERRNVALISEKTAIDNMSVWLNPWKGYEKAKYDQAQDHTKNKGNVSISDCADGIAYCKTTLAQWTDYAISKKLASYQNLDLEGITSLVAFFSHQLKESIQKRIFLSKAARYKYLRCLEVLEARYQVLLDADIAQQEAAARGDVEAWLD
jgi:hypothetical protein